MKIIIMGAGKVGFHIADILAKEGHSITIIENVKEREMYAREKIDAMVIYGDGASEEILLKAGIAKTDLFIAVTDRDEVNILACMLAKEYEVPHKIARVKNMDYSKTVGKINPGKLGIDFLINPRNVVANEICNMVTYLNATEAAEFAGGEAVFITYQITEESPISGLTVEEFVEKRDEGLRFVLMAITHNDEIYIPQLTDVIRPKDLVSFVCKKKDLPGMRKLFGLKTDQSKNVFILGTGEVGLEVAKRLTHKKHNIKIMDRDPARCETASHKLDNALILCSDNTDADTLKNEGVEHSDVFIAVTNDDQANILGALLAKKCGVKRAVTVVNKPELVRLSTSLGVNACVSPRLATASEIIKYIRGKSVCTVAMLDRDNAEVIEFQIPKESEILEIPIKSLELPTGIKIGAIVRQSKVLIPHGSDVLKSSDHVIVFCLVDVIAKAEKFFS